MCGYSPGAGPLPAGELARRTGLTTGAITGVIDRLAQAGLVRRVPDPSDRRRVIIEPDQKRIGRKIGSLFESMGRATAELCSRYTAAELAVIHDFAVRSRALADEETRQTARGHSKIRRVIRRNTRYLHST